MKSALFTIDIPGLGPQILPSYFTLLLLGFLVAILVCQREAKRRDIDPNLIIDLGIWALITGIIGARILHVIADGYFWDYVYTCTDPTLTNWGYTQTECSRYTEQGWQWSTVVNKCVPPPDCLMPLKFWKGGLAYYGGLLFAIPTCIYFVVTRKIGLGHGTDIAGIGIPLGLVFGRIGCFLAGCCFGKVCDLPWGTSFPAGSEASKHQALLSQQMDSIFPELGPHLPFSKNIDSLPVHPTQLYEALACFLIFAYLYFVLSKRRSFDGQLFLVSMILYGIARFGIEFLRDDDRGGLLALSTSQIIAIPLVVVCSILLVVIPRRLAKKKQTAVSK
jgi:phosphatidylglycerol---prolipoprotein diacylglyceryl transferase